MIKRILAVLLCIAVLVCTFSACGDDETYIIYPINQDPECVDPQIAENESSRLITQNCMEGLVRLGSNGEILPGVAKSWEVSSNGLTYTFHLREDSKWQKLKSHSNVLGEENVETFDYRVTADDCLFGIVRALRPETKAKNAYMLYCIKNAEAVNNGEAGEQTLGIKAEDDFTLTINLGIKNDDFLRVLTYPMCMPCKRDFFNATGAKYGLELKYTLCNGPFYLGKWVDNGSLTLYKSESYKGEVPVKTSAVYLYVNKDEEQFTNKFKQGDYNVIPVSDNTLQKVKSFKDVKLLETENKTVGLVFNCQDSLMSNAYIRKAIFCATDLSGVNLADDKAQGIVPDFCRWGSKPYREVAKAVNLPATDSQEALDFYNKGLKELDEDNITINILCEEKYRITVIEIIQNWQKIFGLSLTVSALPVDKEELEKSVKNGEYQIALTTLSVDDASALGFLERFRTEATGNVAGYSSLNYDTLLDKCRGQLGGTKLIEGIKTAEQTLINDGVVYPLLSEKTHLAYYNKVEGIYSISGNCVVDFSLRENDNDS